MIWKIGYHIIKQLNIAFNQDKKTISFPKLKALKHQEKNKGNNNKISDKIILIIILTSCLIANFSIIFYYCYNKIMEKKKKKDLKFKLMLEMPEMINKE